MVTFIGTVQKYASVRLKVHCTIVMKIIYMCLVIAIDKISVLVVFILSGDGRCVDFDFSL